MSTHSDWKPPTPLRKMIADLRFVSNFGDSDDLQVRVNCILMLRSAEQIILRGEDFDVLRKELERIGDEAIAAMEAEEAKVTEFCEGVERIYGDAATDD